VGVLADAVLVRMMLMPAIDALVGKRAFMLPKFVARHLPHIDIEGKAVAALEQAQSETAGSSALVIVKNVLGQSFEISPKTNLLIEYDHAESGRKVLLAIAGRLELDSGYVQVGEHVYPFVKEPVLKNVAYVDLAKTKLNAEGVVGKHTYLAVVDGLNFLEDQTDVENFLQAWADFRALYPDIMLIFGSSAIFDPVLDQIFEQRLVLTWDPQISAQFQSKTPLSPNPHSPAPFPVKLDPSQSSSKENHAV
jgi:hypothetical protein